MPFQIVTKGLGGTIETQFLDRQPASCTVSVYTSQGAAKVSAASATVDSVATTLSSTSAAKATSLSVTSATNVTVNRRYRIGQTTGDDEATEVVTVKSISGTALTLWAPLLLAHTSGDVFQGCRVSYAITSTQADISWINGWATFTPSSGDTQTEAVECYLTKIPDFLCDVTDLRGVFPKLGKALDSELDMVAALRECRDETLLDLGGKNRAHSFLGVAEFRRQAALKFWLLRRYSFGDEWAAQFDKMEIEYEKRKTELISTMPVDADQDGTTTGQNDYGFTVGRLERA